MLCDIDFVVRTWMLHGTYSGTAKELGIGLTRLKSIMATDEFKDCLKEAKKTVKDALDLQTIDIVEVLWDIAQNGERDTDKIGACRELKGYTGGFDNNVQKKEVKHDFEHMSDEELLEVWE